MAEPTAGVAVSVVIPTLDEEENIADCLASLAWADERIVVDSESRDRTRDIAVERGATVVVRPFAGYGAQRNHGVERARHDWILCVDADERASAGLRAEVEGAIARGTCAGYRIPRHTAVLGRRIRHCGWQHDRVLRLYRRSSGRWNDRRVHEVVEVNGEIGDLGAHLEHLSFRDLAHFTLKSRHYALLGAEELHARGRRVGLPSLALLPAARFLKMYLWHLGFLDGVPGLVVSALGAQGVFVKYARLWELSHQPAPDSRARPRRGAQEGET